MSCGRPKWIRAERPVKRPGDECYLVPSLKEKGFVPRLGFISERIVNFRWRLERLEQFRSSRF